MELDRATVYVTKYFTPPTFLRTEEIDLVITSKRPDPTSKWDALLWHYLYLWLTGAIDLPRALWCAITHILDPKIIISVALLGAVAYYVKTGDPLAFPVAVILVPVIALVLLAVSAVFTLISLPFVLPAVLSARFKKKVKVCLAEGVEHEIEWRRGKLLYYRGPDVDKEELEEIEELEEETPRDIYTERLGERAKRAITKYLNGC